MKTLTALMIGLSMAVATTAHAEDAASSVVAAPLVMASGSALDSSRILPTYPGAALRNGEHFGRVRLGYDVDATGMVSNVRVLSAYPARVFTRASMRAVENWRFAPGEAGSRAIEFTFVAD
jgi:TonB family protein